ncbi:MAG: glycosyltransferase family 2 protein [Candidatus Gracilibacteria bacterium]|nr:glycosyltransferase family 2 protein [Candidatus Gracilibacteria bacterium]
MELKFSIITPTYKRNDLLIRAINSLINQNYRNWEMIIIDDYPLNNLDSFLKSINSEKIKYFKNKKNEGCNYSRNKGLKNVNKKSDYIIFLDDDDYFNINTLKNINNFLKGKNINWLITNKIDNKGNKISKITGNKISYNYIYDYLFGKNIIGDVTHIIKNNIINNLYFPNLIKNGEEWIFFYKIAKKNNIYYFDEDSTICEYLEGGLTLSKENNYILNRLKYKNILFEMIKNKIYNLKLLIKFFGMYLFTFKYIKNTFEYIKIDKIIKKIIK